MNDAYLALGSNLKHRERQIRLALRALAKHPLLSVKAIAPLYLNEATGRRGMPPYCNTVINIRTRLDPFALLKVCHQLESRQGRQRKVRFGARTLDIDILFYNDWSVKTKTLTIPHPEIEHRDFVKVPLQTIRNRATCRT